MAAAFQGFYDPDLQYDENYWRERYMEEVFPYLRANGPEIGERAMQGDSLAEEIVRRTAIFQQNWHPENFRILVQDLKAWCAKRAN